MRFLEPQTTRRLYTQHQRHHGLYITQELILIPQFKSAIEGPSTCKYAKAYWTTLNCDSVPSKDTQRQTRLTNYNIIYSHLQSFIFGSEVAHQELSSDICHYQTCLALEEQKKTLIQAKLDKETPDSVGARSPESPYKRSLDQKVSQWCRYPFGSAGFPFRFLHHIQPLSCANLPGFPAFLLLSTQLHS